MNEWNLGDFIAQSCLIDKQFDEFGGLVPGAKPGDPMYDRHLAALEVAEEIFTAYMLGSSVSLPEDFALDIHRALTRGLEVFERENASGRYRTHDVSILRTIHAVSVNPVTVVKTYTEENGDVICVAPVGQVVRLMRERWVPEVASRLSAGVGTRESALSAAFWCHDFFECIHPFIDGNGRTGRVIMAGITLALGFEPVVIWKADQYRYYDKIDKWRAAYYAQSCAAREAG